MEKNEAAAYDPSGDHGSVEEWKADGDQNGHRTLFGGIPVQ